MLNIIKHKNIFFLISGLVIIPGIISLILWGMRPGIDFTGGTLLELSVKDAQKEDVKKIFEGQKIEVGSIQDTGTQTYLFRSKPISNEQHQKLLTEIKKAYPGAQETRFETVGPTIGKETTTNAAKAVVVASVMIILYISWAFRHIPKPYSSWSFGIAAVAALIHDALLVIGVFSLLGHYWNVEVDSLFITALLTVMGFSVHDTIVVFDRIRENLRRMRGVPFDHIVNDSIVQTMVRSVSTSLTVIFTLVALVLFGGESIRWFVVALLIGIISGTYSSIFNAAPLLVAWEEWKEKRKNKSGAGFKAGAGL